MKCCVVRKNVFISQIRKETKNLSGLKDGDTAGYISLGMKYIAISVTK